MRLPALVAAFCLALVTACSGSSTVAAPSSSRSQVPAGDAALLGRLSTAEIAFAAQADAVCRPYAAYVNSHSWRGRRTCSISR
jgi:hypothetical protein